MEDLHTDAQAPARAPAANKGGMSGTTVALLGVLLLIIIGGIAYAMQGGIAGDRDADDDTMPAAESGMPADQGGYAGDAPMGSAGADVEVQ